MSTPRLRPFSELSKSGILWAINRFLFHPRGYALAVSRDTGTGEVTRWGLTGNGTAPFGFGPRVDSAAFEDFERTLAEAKAENNSPLNANADHELAHDGDEVLFPLADPFNTDPFPETGFRCEVVDGKLVIEIGTVPLALLAIQHQDYRDGQTGGSILSVTDAEKLALAVAKAFKAKHPDGCTLLGLMLEHAIADAVEAGCEGIELGDTPTYPAGEAVLTPNCYLDTAEVALPSPAEPFAPVPVPDPVVGTPEPQAETKPDAVPPPQ